MRTCLPMIYRIVNTRKLFILFLAIVLSHTAWCQFEISAQGAYNIILDDTKSVYRNGASYMMSVSFTAKNTKNRKVIGLFAGYSTFNPQKESFELQSADGEPIGSASYSDLKTLQTGINARLDFPINKVFEFFVGSDLGFQRMKYDTDVLLYDYMVSGESSDTGWFIAPRAGINFILGKKMSALFCARYSVSKNPVSFAENNLAQNMTLGVGLNYRIEK
jgi:hypothetical protein